MGCYQSKRKNNLKLYPTMKLLIVLAFIFAFIAIGFLVATLFAPGTSVVLPSIGAGLALVAFILVFVGYVTRTNRQK